MKHILSLARKHRVVLSAVPGVNQSEHTHPAEGGKNGDHSLGSNASKDSVVVRFREPLAQRVIEGACQERSVSVLCLDLKDELTSFRFTSVAAKAHKANYQNRGQKISSLSDRERG